MALFISSIMHLLLSLTGKLLPPKSSLSTQKSNLYLLPTYWLSSFLFTPIITQWKYRATIPSLWVFVLELFQDIGSEVWTTGVLMPSQLLFCQFLLPSYFVRPLVSDLIFSNSSILSFVGPFYTIFLDLPCALQWGFSVASFWTYHVLFCGAFL